MQILGSPLPLGTEFFMPKHTLDNLYEAVQGYKFFWLDDVLLGGLLVFEFGINVTESELSQYYADCGGLIKAHHLESMKDMVECRGTNYPLDEELLWSGFCHAPLSNAKFEQLMLQYSIL